VAADLANWNFSTVFPVYCRASKINLTHSIKDRKDVDKVDGNGAG